jgi:hypothetical protein
MTAHRRIRRQPRITARVKARRENGSRSSFLAKKRPLVSNSVGSAGRCVEKGLQREQAQAVVLLAGEHRPAGQLKQRRHPARPALITQAILAGQRRAAQCLRPPFRPSSDSRFPDPGDLHYARLEP